MTCITHDNLETTVVPTLFPQCEQNKVCLESQRNAAAAEIANEKIVYLSLFPQALAKFNHLPLKARWKFNATFCFSWYCFCTH